LHRFGVRVIIALESDYRKRRAVRAVRGALSAVRERAKCARNFG